MQKEKSFFVKIPMEINSDGWPMLLKTPRDFMGKEPGEEVAGLRWSFVELVKPERFNMGGTFRVLVEGRQHVVRVDTSGVGARKAYLRRFLVV